MQLIRSAAGIESTVRWYAYRMLTGLEAAKSVRHCEESVRYTSAISVIAHDLAYIVNSKCDGQAGTWKIECLEFPGNSHKPMFAKRNPLLTPRELDAIPMMTRLLCCGSHHV